MDQDSPPLTFVFPQVPIPKISPGSSIESLRPEGLRDVQKESTADGGCVTEGVIGGLTFGDKGVFREIGGELG